MSRAHVAGSLHADAAAPHAAFPATWVQPPSDVNDLLPSLWAQTVSRGPDGVLRVGGLDVITLARDVGTPAYVVDEVDFRAPQPVEHGFP